MKQLLFFSITLSMLAACNNKTDSVTTRAPVKLTEGSLYNIDSVKAMADSVSSTQQELAKKKFLEAADLYFNKKQIPQSIAAFKASLLISPSEKTYFTLSQALRDNKNFDEALKAIQVAEYMNYSPLANILYQKAVLYSQMPGDKLCSDGYTKWNDSLTIHFMEVALQMGYSKPKDFLQNKTFDSVRINYDYLFNDSYSKAMSGNRDPEKLAWENFKSEFNDIKLPLTINTVWIYEQKYENAIGFDYEKFVPEMRNGKFSREVENEFFYVGKLKEDSVYTALLYAGKNMWLTDGRGYAPIYFYLVTFNPQGSIIDKMLVGGQKTFTDKFRQLTLKENLGIEIKEFKNVYEKDPETAGYENNKVIKSDLLASSYFKINNKGKFEKADQLAIAK